MEEIKIDATKANSIEQLVDDIVQIYAEKDYHPFPREDCKKIMGEHYEKNVNLIPHLDLYFSDIAGYCSWGRKILKWSNNQVREAENRLKKTFFEKYPQYKMVKHLITEANTPDLYRVMRIYETMRKLLLRVLSQLQA